MSAVTEALIIILASAVTEQPARLTEAQRRLVGGYLLPNGKVDPREVHEAREHLRRLGGPAINI